jgi:hypothetical protein
LSYEKQTVLSSDRTQRNLFFGGSVLYHQILQFSILFEKMPNQMPTSQNNQVGLRYKYRDSKFKLKRFALIYSQTITAFNTNVVELGTTRKIKLRLTKNALKK